MITELISTQRMPDYGYELRTEWWKTCEEEKPIQMVAAYSLSGQYIGNAVDAYILCIKMGIRPELSQDQNNVCSIGYCKKEQKWYGWSHRAIFGFKIGDVVKEGDCTNSSGYVEEFINKHPECDLSQPVGFKAETLDDAKRMAIAFANSVS